MCFWGVLIHKAKKIGKSQGWVNKRIRTALDLTTKVANALDKGLISFSVAEIIGGLDTNLQDLFLEYILSNKITDPDDVRKAK